MRAGMEASLGIETGDRDAVMAAVGTNGNLLRHAREEFRADREIVLRAVSQHWKALEAATPELRRDREVVLAAVGSFGEAAQFAGEELRADKEVCLLAMKLSGKVLEYFSSDLRADREVVLAAVRRTGLALEFASKELQADREVVLVAVSQDARAFKHASVELRDDFDFVMEAVSLRREALVFNVELKQMERSYVCYGWMVLRYASPTVRSNTAVIKKAVEFDWRALAYAAAEVRADRDIVRAAAAQEMQHGKGSGCFSDSCGGSGGLGSLDYAAPELLRDDEFLASVSSEWPARYVLARVTLLSGRSCLVLLNNERLVTMRSFLECCAMRLGLTGTDTAQAHIIHGDTCLSEEQLQSWLHYDAGRLNDLQLILQRAS